MTATATQARPDDETGLADRIPVETNLPSSDVRCSVRKSNKIPLFVEPVEGKFDSADSFVSWVAAHRPELDDLIIEQGAIVFRGFPVTNSVEFNEFVQEFPQYGPGYVAGASVRQKIVGNVLETSRIGGAATIGVHSEMNYLDTFPSRICFFCESKAEEGGETMIADIREVSKKLPESWKERVRRLKIRTVRNFSPPADTLDQRVAIPEQMPWHMAFGTSDKAELERICKRMDLELHWRDDGGITVISLVEGLNVHPATGQELYRAIIHKPPMTYSKEQQAVKDAALASQKYQSGYTLGDGSLGTEEERAVVVEAIEDATTYWPWQNGDIMMLDNLQIWHGRRPYVGEHREVHVAILD